MTATRINQTALITGSGRKRVGYVVAKTLARAGYNVAIHFNRSEDTAEDNANEIRGLGVECEKFQADVSEESEVCALISGVVDRFGSLDVLVATSSIWKTIPLDEVSAEDVLASFRVNTLGTFLCCRHAGMQMVSQERGGNIVTIGDSLIDHPYLDHTAYFTAKGSIPCLTKSFAVELAARNPNVRVNCIEPGPVMFPDEMSEEEKRASIEATLVKKADHPETVAKTVLFFIDNPMLTGCCIPLDGGRNVGREQHARSLQ